MNKLIFTLLLTAFSLNLSAQNSDPDKAIAFLKSFYTAYITEVSSSHDGHQMENNLSSLRRKYFTAHCEKRYELLGEQTDADPVIKAQDSDVRLLKTLSVKKDLKKTNVYAVSYTDTNAISKVKTVTTINLEVITYKGDLKINFLW